MRARRQDPRLTKKKGSASRRGAGRGSPPTPLREQQHYAEVEDDDIIFEGRRTSPAQMANTVAGESALLKPQPSPARRALRSRSTAYFFGASIR
jgi:hypothetical protein